MSNAEVLNLTVSLYENQTIFSIHLMEKYKAWITKITSKTKGKS